MKKEELTSMNISEEVASFVTSEDRDNRLLNQEGIEVGEKFTIKGIADTVSSGTINGAVRKWIDVKTSGDRSSISIARLVGTQKVSKYFDVSRKTEDGKELATLAPDFDATKVLRLPNREGDAIKEVASNLIGKTLKCVGIATMCGRFNQTFYAFEVVA